MRTERLGKFPIIVPKKKTFIETPKDEVALHGVFVIVGRRGSGKSVAVSSKLRHLKQAGFADRVWLVSPTAISNAEMWDGIIDPDDVHTEMDNSSIEHIVEAIEHEAAEYFEYERVKVLYDKLQKALKRHDPEHIDAEFLMECLEAGVLDMMAPPVYKYGHRPRFHIVLDDVQSSKLFCPSTKNKLLNMTIRHRHIADGIGVSLWFCVQNYSTNSGIPRAIRENCTGLAVFPIKDEKMLDMIAQEAAGEIGKAAFLKAYEYATKGSPHDFLYVDFAPKDRSKALRKKWDEYILMTADDVNKKKIL